MTAITDRPHLLPEEFDEATRILARTTEGVRLELIDGRLRSRVVPDGDHGRIIEWLTRICLQSQPELWLYPDQGFTTAGRAHGFSEHEHDGVDGVTFCGCVRWGVRDVLGAIWDAGCGVSSRGPRFTREMARGLPVASGHTHMARS
ncbi:hypothetical protein [Streptomyces hypolithicus]